MNKFENPLYKAEKTIYLLSGDHAEENISASFGNRIVLSISPFSVFKIEMLGLPSSTAAKTNFLLSGDQEPVELINSKSCKWVLNSFLKIFLMILPVFASAKKRSIENKSLDEKNTSLFPSGLIAGETLIDFSPFSPLIKTFVVTH